jgi:hypothetical protein
MSDTTTVRVAKATREHLNRLSAARGESVDSTIQRGLRLIELEDRRRQAESEARVLAADSVDRAEIAAAIRDLTGE